MHERKVAAMTGTNILHSSGVYRGVSSATGPLPAATSPGGVLDVYINDGFVPMVDGALVYHRGFGERPTAVSDPRPSLAVSPHVFTAAGEVLASRTYPLGRPLPPAGRPQPLRPDPAEDGFYLPRRAHWAS